jgi:hypothetical protein
MIERKVDFTLELTAREIAQEFCRLDSEGQAVFFNSIADIVASEWKAPFCFQLEAITDEDALTPEGRDVMSQIGDYSKNQFR